jgi:hypothetical protein
MTLIALGKIKSDALRASIENMIIAMVKDGR